jgi:hypothetical protein
MEKRITPNIILSPFTVQVRIYIYKLESSTGADYAHPSASCSLVYIFKSSADADYVDHHYYILPSSSIVHVIK